MDVVATAMSEAFRLRGLSESEIWHSEILRGLRSRTQGALRIEAPRPCFRLARRYAGPTPAG